MHTIISTAAPYAGWHFWLYDGKDVHFVHIERAVTEDDAALHAARTILRTVNGLSTEAKLRLRQISGVEIQANIGGCWLSEPEAWSGQGTAQMTAQGLWTVFDGRLIRGLTRAEFRRWLDHQFAHWRLVPQP